MADPLLTSKIRVPPLRPQERRVSRPRLIARLDKGLEPNRKLTIISAPAGFGKTTLLSEWIDARSRDYGVESTEHTGSRASTPSSLLPTPRFSWLSLDEDDNDLGSFFAYWHASLEQIVPDIGDTLRAALQATTVPQAKPLVSALTHELEKSDDCTVLVLDDYHTIHNPEIHRALDFFIEHLPANVHLVISGRIEPPLPLPRLRVRDQMTEIRPADLRFTLPETTSLLNDCFLLDLDTEDISALTARTEGWVASLQLAALSLQNHADRRSFVAAFSGSHRYVIDYLMDEVIVHQPDNIVHFLLRTSVLDRLCAPLCNAIADITNGQEILEHMDRAHLFVIPLDDQRQWYRYHHLFSDVLQARLRAESPGTMATLHRQAAEWYRSQDLTADAVHHALAAKAYREAAQWIGEAVTDTFRRGQVTTVRRWLDALPENLVHSTPLLALSYAWVSVIAVDAHSIDDYMDGLEHLLRTAPADSPELRAVWLSNAMAIRSTRALHLNQVPEVITYAQKGLELLSDQEETEHRLHSVLEYNLALAFSMQGEVGKAIHAYRKAIHEAEMADHAIITAFAGYHLGELHRLCGRIKDAATVHEQTLARIQAMAPTSPPMGLCYIGLGAVEYDRFDLPAAQEHLETGIVHCQRAGTAEITAEGYRWLSCVLLAQGKEKQARIVLENALQVYGSLNHVEATARAAICRAQHHLLQGNPAQLREWVDTYQPISGTADETVLCETLTLAYACLALGHTAQASRLLNRLESSRVHGRAIAPVAILVLRALISHRQGQTIPARRALEQALDQAAPENHVRPFLCGGPVMAEMLQRYSAQTSVQQSFTDRLLTILQPTRASRTDNDRHESAIHDAPLREPLSEREREVLHLMAAGLKYKEIADQLFITVNTVNYHVKNLYGKLGVRNRARAVARARQLELLS